jgi:hypothetical protein
MKKHGISLVMILAHFNITAAVVNINTTTGGSFQFEIASQASILDCNGLKTFIANQSFSEIQFNSVNTNCTGIVLDGYFYSAPANMTINIYHASKIFIVNQFSMTNCLNGQGQLPSIGFDFIFSVGSSTIGITNIKYHENSSILEMDSQDGDVVCDGGIPYNADIIFKNGFE